MVVSQKRNFLKPKGISNIGNTCFFNASMQCLLSVSDFVSYYENTFFGQDMPVSKAFSKFITTYKNNELISPNEFVSNIRKKIRLFSGNQEDAHEFIVRFLEALHDELPGELKSIKNKEDFLKHQQQNIIADLFYSFKLQTISCGKCDYRSESFVLNNMMGINPVETSQEGLNRVFDKEKIEGFDKRKCEGCSLVNTATKQLEIIVYPKVLILYIHRFTMSISKNTRQVQIDKQIKLSSSTYYLRGVVYHSGTIKYGHYYADAKRSGTWMNYNDSAVSSNIGSFDGNSPYIAFYTKTI